MDDRIFIWLALLAIATVHLAAGQLRFLSGESRSVWLSVGRGISMAYVFLHLLPDLAAHQNVMKSSGSTVGATLDQPGYFVALLGLAGFYGLERWAMRERGMTRVSAPDATPPGVFWASVAVFAIYNALLVYLLAREGREHPLELFLFTFAVALHFAVNDHGLYQHHKHLYARYGRWLLAGAAVVGGAIEPYVPASEAATATAMALLIGAMILNTLKDELPGRREGHFAAFLLGLLGYSALFIAM